MVGLGASLCFLATAIAPPCGLQSSHLHKPAVRCSHRACPRGLRSHSESSSPFIGPSAVACYPALDSLDSCSNPSRKNRPRPRKYTVVRNGLSCCALPTIASKRMVAAFSPFMKWTFRTTRVPTATGPCKWTLALCCVISTRLPCCKSGGLARRRISSVIGQEISNRLSPRGATGMALFPRKR